MNKKVRSVVVIVLLSTVFLLCFNSNDGKHMTGRDTVEVFGNGDFQIIGKKPSHFADLERKATLEENVKQYKFVRNKIYVFGKRGYTIVNIEEGTVKQYVLNLEDKNWDRINIPNYGKDYIRLKEFEDFSIEEQEVFNQM